MNNHETSTLASRVGEAVENLIDCAVAYRTDRCDAHSLNLHDARIALKAVLVEVLTLQGKVRT